MIIMSVKRSRRKIFALIFAMLIIVAFLVVFLYNTPLFIFSEQLSVENFRKVSDGFTADVEDLDGKRIANIYIIIPSRIPSVGVVKVSIWHDELTKLDSLTLIFSSNDLLVLALETPKGLPWPSMDFHRTSDGKGSILNIADLGFQGEGTITVDFLLQIYADEANVSLDIQFSLHKKAPFTFTKYTAKTLLNTQIQKQT